MIGGFVKLTYFMSSLGPTKNGKKLGKKGGKMGLKTAKNEKN